MFPLPLIVQVGDSPALRALLIGLHLLAVTAVWLAKLPWESQIELQVGVSILLLASLWRYAKPRASLTLRCHQDGKLEQQTKDGWETLQMDGVAVLLPGLILQRHKVAAKMRPKVLLITADALAAEDWRRLNVWFRLLSNIDRGEAIKGEEVVG